MKKLIIVLAIIFCASIMFAYSFLENGDDKPFDVTVEGFLSFVGAPPTGIVNFGAIIITNNDPDEELPVNFKLIRDDVPENWINVGMCTSSACDVENWDVDIPAGEKYGVYA